MATFKKKFDVIKTTKKDVDGVEVAGQKMVFGKSGAFSVTDPAKAKDIDQLWGIQSRKTGKMDEVIVVESDNNMVEQGHTYTFSVGGVPWARYDELGRRLPDKPEDEGVEHGAEGSEQAEGERSEAGS